MTLAKTVPGFAALAAAVEWDSRTIEGPAPLEIVSAEAAHQAFFPEQDPEPSDPLGAAYLWWSALLAKSELTDALHALTWNPPAWGDYELADQLLGGVGIMQFVERCPDDDNIAYVKFIPDVDQPMRAFGEMPIQRARILTMVLSPDGWWRAWGLSHDHFPSAAEVRGDANAKD